MTAPLAGSAQASFSERYGRAEEAWFQGRFSETIEILEGISARTATQRADVALLMSRALLRVNAFERALLAARGISVHADDDRQATALLLEGAALSRLGQLEDAEAILEAVPVSAKIHRTIAAEILLERARVAYQRRSEPEALTRARRLTIASIGKADDIVLARAQELLGYVNVAELRYGDAAKSFREALSTLHGSSRRDALLEANVVHMATTLAAERMDISVLPMGEEAARRIPWNADMADAHFQVAQNIGWLALVAGELPQAWRWFHESLELTVGDDPLRAMGLTNLASLHRIVGETFSAGRYLDEAAALIEDVAWEQVDVDRRMAYLEWIIEAKRQGRDVRADMIVKFAKLPDGQGLKALERDDPRAHALYDTARGLILWRSADTAPAKRILKRALMAWSSLGFTYRAATLALDLHAFTNDRAFLDAATALCSGLRVGPLRARIAGTSRKESRGISDLTPTERAVLKRILAGKSAQQIADESKRSVQTIKNQTRRIFKAMNVKSRAQLLVLCADLGITKSM